jgi:hypothetical protein
MPNKFAVKILSACVFSGLWLSATLAAADTIEDVNFTYTDPDSGNLTATGTLTVDVTTDQALSGSGTITSSLFVNAGSPPTPMGARSFFLVTLANCAATSGNCVIPSPSGGTFQWADSDGTNLSGDTYFSLSAPYVSSAGLLFAVGNTGAHGGGYDSFNLYSLGGTALGEFLGAGGAAQSQGGTQVYNEGADGTLTINSITPVPIPNAGLLLLSGIAVLGRLADRRRIPLS